MSHKPYSEKEAQIAYKYEVYKDKKDEYRFRFKVPNDQTMFSGEEYRQKLSATKAIESIKKNVGSAEIDE
jgi:uncharacterized protein YegP (UPF0339 family)